MATNDNMDTNAGAGCEDDRKLFAGGLPQDAKEAQIKEHFGPSGEIETVTLKTDTATGRSRGSFGKRAANAFLVGLASLLPTPASGSDDGYDPITNLIR